MGKIARQRKKYHLEAPKSASKIEHSNESFEVKNVPVPTTTDIFKNVTIDLPSLKQQLLEFDTESLISNKTSGSQISKKDKRKLKKELFQKKIELIKEARREEKSRKKRQNTPIVGDMKPLGDALPTLEMLLRDIEKSRKEKKEQKEKPRGCKSFKAQQKAMMEDITAFQQILNHPTFKEDPEGTVRLHIENVVNEENMEAT